MSGGAIGLMVLYLKGDEYECPACCVPNPKSAQQCRACEAPNPNPAATNKTASAAPTKAPASSGGLSALGLKVCLLVVVVVDLVDLVELCSMYCVLFRGYRRKSTNAQRAMSPTRNPRSSVERARSLTPTQLPPLLPLRPVVVVPSLLPSVHLASRSCWLWSVCAETC